MVSRTTSLLDSLHTTKAVASYSTATEILCERAEPEFRCRRGPVCIALRTGDCDDDIKQAIATKLLALAKAGERNPDILCEEALKDIRRPQQWAAAEAARSAVLRDSPGEGSN